MQIRIVEVGPRDGLQNETVNIPLDLKILFINALSACGLKYIETTSFVSPKWVPQMADHSEVMRGIQRASNVTYSALVPNLQGFDDALASKVDEIAVFTAVSETFCQKNINSNIDASLKKIKAVVHRAQQHKIKVRGYLSCALGCPYEGAMALKKTAQLAEQLIQLGCYEVSLGDTIGVGTAHQAKALVKTVSKAISLKQIAVHFHDTYAQALTNIYACLEQGIRIIDSAVAGLGGCPYAPGAGGNVATEDVVYLLEGLGLKTGIELKDLANAGRLICDFLQQPPRSKVSLALANAVY